MRLLPLLAVLLLALPAQAQTLLRLTEVGQVNAHPDQLAASLRVEVEGNGPVEVQARVNTAIAAALAQAKTATGVTASTSSYSVWQAQANPQAPKIWHAAQGLDLSSGDGPALLALVGSLQAQGLAVSQLGWRLAPTTARAAHDQAVQLALKQLRGHAEQAAVALGLGFVGFKSVDLDPGAGGFQPRGMVNFAAAMPAPVAPVAEAADVTVEARVAAEVMLEVKR